MNELNHRNHFIQKCTLLYSLITSLLVFGDLYSQVHPGEAFIGKYCLECHDSAVEKGDRNFEELFFPLGTVAEIIEAQEVVDQLNLGDMPPPKADQPTDKERAEAIASISKEIREAHGRLKSTDRQTVLRRLNEREYINTVEALFQRRVDTFHPTANFPADQTRHHIDTIGDELVTSSFLLQNYFDAANQIVEKALAQETKPEVKSWHFKDRFKQGQELSYSHKNVYNYKYLCLYEVPNTVNHEGGYAGLEEFREGVHAAGIYEVKVLAHSKNRDSHYDKSIFQMDLSEKFRLGIVTGDSRSGNLHHPQSIEPKLAEVTLEDGEPKWYTMRVWLEKGQQPRFIFPNGMANCRNAFVQIGNQYRKEWPKDDKFFKKRGIVEARRVVLEHGKMPHIRIHEVKVQGPFYSDWPPKPQKVVFGSGDFAEAHRNQVIEQFARKAYRRPPTESELKSLVAIAEQRIKNGRTPRDATMDALKAALCSPAFLYLGEKDQKGLLGSHDLAARLSYFITGTSPDAALSNLADSGEVLEMPVLISELERLIDSSSALEFYDGFTDSWLGLRELGGMPPDRSVSAQYFYDDLEKAMKGEVVNFTRHMVAQNRKTREFLDSDYTFVNHPLAQLYKISFPFPKDQRYQFKKVKLNTKKRGGLLGMGGVLTVSANGIETSPVTRGVFILENLLGTPTAPPPDEVPEIEPDTRGATTIRDQLVKHRESKTCAECHRKIDPPGFALENFDPIGRWRTSYPPPNKRKAGSPIDASGKFSDGTEFENIVDFKKHLLTKNVFFTRHLAETLLSYATGREMEPLDRIQIDQVLEKSKDAQGEYRMRSLLKNVVRSEIFRSP